MVVHICNLAFVRVVVMKVMKYCSWHRLCCAVSMKSIIEQCVCELCFLFYMFTHFEEVVGATK